MSRYGDSDYNREKNDIYYELEEFLENHPIFELLQIVSDVIQYEKGE